MAPDRARLGLILAAVFLISASGLGLQILLTRLLSVVLSYHFVFAVVSLAMLGLGAGALLIHFYLRGRPSAAVRPLPTLSVLTALAAITTLVLVEAIAVVARVVPGAEALPLYLVAMAPPFLLSGAALALAFRTWPRASGSLYGADLIGAALGSAGAVLGLELVGGVQATFVVALALGAAALLLALSAGIRTSPPTALAAGALPLAALVLAATSSGLYVPRLPTGLNPEKEIHDALFGPFGGGILETLWSSFGRTDLVAFRQDPGYMDIYIDGTAGTPMYRFSGDVEAPGTAAERLAAEFPGFFPFRFLDDEHKRSALVIGSGGGRDILLAKLAGIERITAVEVNPDVVELVRRYGSYNGGIYTGLDGVDVVVAEGRSFVKRSDERHDVIFMSLPVTNTSRSPEGYALTESFLLTTEAVLDYLGALTEGGQLIVVAHDDAEILRLIALARSALAAGGLNDRAVMERIYALGSFPYPVFVLASEPIDREKALAIHAAALRAGYSPSTSFVPHVTRPDLVSPPLAAVSAGHISFERVVELAREAGQDVRPVGDDSPFFYHFEIGWPAAIRLVFWTAAAALAVFALLPIVLRRRPKGFAAAGTDDVRALLVFTMLGIGFMLVEISLAQRFLLFIGQPVLTLAILLAALLLSAGLGSLASARVPAAHIESAIASAALAAIALICAYAVMLPVIFEAFLGELLPVRAVIMAGLLAPLGIALGMPFPLAIRALSHAGQAEQVPWMWALNGVASVFGSAAAIALALSHGFTEVLLAGAACYLLIVFVCLGRPALARSSRADVS